MFESGNIRLLFRRVGLYCMTLVMIMNTSVLEAKRPVKLKFDPAVEGGLPSLAVSPAEDPVEGVHAVRLTAYALEEQEIVLATKEITIGETLHFVLPDRGRNDILGVRIEALGDGEPTAIAEWRAMYFTRGRLLDYRGSRQLRRPADFRAYWDEARRQLAETHMSPEIVPVPERTTETGHLYRVKLNSYGNVPIVCWYYVPKDVDPRSGRASVRKYPAIQIMPGWGAEEPPIDRTAEGFITLSLNPRCHGPSKEYFNTEVPHHLWNIDNPEEYYYRAAYMDCLRGIDFLASRSEVDIERIGVEGGSQGGAFALATAALDRRVSCVVSNVPYISNFPDFVRLSTLGSGAAFAEKMNDPEIGRTVRRTLAYIDVSNLAPWIRCPVMVTVGLMDPVCPPANGIVALNRLPGRIPRRLVLDPDAVHEVSSLMRQANREWYQEHLAER